MYGIIGINFLLVAIKNRFMYDQKFRSEINCFFDYFNHLFVCFHKQIMLVYNQLLLSALRSKLLHFGKFS